MIGEHARPHDVDLQDVDVGRTRGEQRLVEGEPLIAVGRRGDEADLVAGLLRPFIRTRLAELKLDAERAAGERNRDFRFGIVGKKGSNQRRCRNQTPDPDHRLLPGRRRRRGANLGK
jgi:hypothetical protein